MPRTNAIILKEWWQGSDLVVWGAIKGRVESWIPMKQESVTRVARRRDKNCSRHDESSVLGRYVKKGTTVRCTPEEVTAKASGFCEVRYLSTVGRYPAWTHALEMLSKPMTTIWDFLIRDIELSPRCLFQLVRWALRVLDLSFPWCIGQEPRTFPIASDPRSAIWRLSYWFQIQKKNEQPVTYSWRSAIKRDWQWVLSSQTRIGPSKVWMLSPDVDRAVKTIMIPVLYTSSKTTLPMTSCETKQRLELWWWSIHVVHSRSYC